MKRQIRFGVFETNSSSTHSVTILTDDQYNQYKRGELLISRDAAIVSKDEYNKQLENEKKSAQKTYETDPYCRKYYSSFEEYWESCYDGVKYEFDERNMDIQHAEKEINGEKVHALSVYGYES